MEQRNFRAVDVVQEKSSLSLWIALLITVLYLFVAPFYKGLFNGWNYTFERPLYTTFISFSVVLLLLSVHFISNFRINNWNDLGTLLIWLIPFVYLISMFTAVSHYYSTVSFYLNCLYAVFFLAGWSISKQRSGRFVLQLGILVSGYLLVVYGLANWFGYAHYQDAVFGGFRLSNVFQYPNSYAAYLIGLLFSCLIYSVATQKWYFSAIHSIMMVPIVLSYLLTASRGSLIILPIVLVVFLVFMPFYKQLKAIIALLVPVLISFVLSTVFVEFKSPTIEGTASFKGWILLAASSALSYIIVFFIHRVMDRYLAEKTQYRTKAKKYNFVLPGLILMCGIVGGVLIFSQSSLLRLLPSTLQTRLSSINLNQSSAFLRNTYYNDSFKVFKDYPLVGAGGGAWQNIYEKYQSFPYISNQTHNFFSQYLLETGIIGSLFLLVLLVYIFYRFVRNYFRSQPFNEGVYHLVYLVMVLAILIHSALDFDMSYLYLSSLVFMGLGGMCSLQANGVLGKPLPDIFQRFSRYKLYAVLSGMISIFLLIVSIRLLNGNTMFTQAQDAMRKQDFNGAVKYFERASSSVPHKPDYILSEVNLLKQAYLQNKNQQLNNDANTLMQSLKPYEPYNRQLFEEEYSSLLMKGKYEEALALATEHLSYHPWDSTVNERVSLYEKVITLNFELGNRAVQSKATDAANRYWDTALQVFNQLEHKVAEFNRIPKESIENQTMQSTPNTNLAIGQIFFLTGKYALAETVLQQFLDNNFDNPRNKAIARWYLASLYIQNKNDSSLYNALIAKDPDEKRQIEIITKK